jgi:fluoride exporter
MEQDSQYRGPAEIRLTRASLQRLDHRELAAIFAGGFIGAIARAGLAHALPERSDRWPWATFVVNVLAALLLGYFTTRLQQRQPPSHYGRAFLATGVCGALGTFSAMALELLRMIESAHWALAASYTVASVVCGLAALFFAIKLARRVRFDT